MRRRLKDAYTQDQLRDLMRGLLIAPFVLLILFGCARLAVLGITIPAATDIRSHLGSDYNTWPYISIPPIRTEIVGDILHDQQLYSDTLGNGPLPTVVAGDLWPTQAAGRPPATAIPAVTPTMPPPTAAVATATRPPPTPTATPLPTSSPTPTRRPTRVIVPTATLVPPTPSDTPTSVPPASPTPSCAPPEFFDPIMNRCRMPDTPVPFSATPTSTPTNTPTTSPTPVPPTVMPTGTPTSPPTATRTPVPTSTPIPPTATPTGTPTSTPTVTPVPIPDLVVISITWSPPNPVGGGNVIFSATIKNQGSGPTPNGVVHAVNFYVDACCGSAVTWSDNYTTSISPGASVLLTANTGVGGNNFWVAISGTHTITAWVNPSGLIPESNTSNNMLSATLTVP